MTREPPFGSMSPDLFRHLGGERETDLWSRCAAAVLGGSMTGQVCETPQAAAALARSAALVADATLAEYQRRVYGGRYLGSCDWGDCNEPAVTWRDDPDHGPLPVCRRHES